MERVERRKLSRESPTATFVTRRKNFFSAAAKSDVDRLCGLPYSPAHTHRTTCRREQTHTAWKPLTSLLFTPARAIAFRQSLVVQTDFETPTPD
jgi:hypothetical protein